MCGHGLIGVVRTLEHLGWIGTGQVEIDTPVGPVSATLEPDGAVTIRNVPARVYQTDVSVEVPELGTVTGDVAWGGNWFFLTSIDVPLEFARRHELLGLTTRIREALIEAGITGEAGALIDHVELFGPPSRSDADARNFVLCPGSAYDRSPCGTGTSAKLAVLHHRATLRTGDPWRQESIIGSCFTGWLEEEQGELIPYIRGNAWITARSTLLFDRTDPYAHGLG
jgi:proline racemase